MASESYLENLWFLLYKVAQPLKSVINVNKALAQAGILEANLIQSECFSKKLILSDLSC